jgi:hypothetical protein
MTGFGYDPDHAIVKARQAGRHYKTVPLGSTPEQRRMIIKNPEPLNRLAIVSRW